MAPACVQIMPPYSLDIPPYSRLISPHSPIAPTPSNGLGNPEEARGHTPETLGNTPASHARMEPVRQTRQEFNRNTEHSNDHRKTMRTSLAFVKNRAGKTIAAALAVMAKWVWPEKTIAQLQALLTAIVGDATATPPLPGQEGVTSAAEQAMLNARAAWDAGLDQLHTWTMNGLALARTHFMNQPAKLALLAGLTAKGESRPGILAEALAWEAAWSQADAAYAPLPGVTVAAFDTLRLQCLTTLQTDYNQKFSAWRDQVGILGRMAADLEQLLVAWYADATRIFDGGTPEGQMIRGTIPTTYDGAGPATPPTPPPNNPTPTPGSP